MTGDSGKIGVFLLDDHQVVRRGLKDMLEDEPDFTVVGEGSTAAEAGSRLHLTRPKEPAIAPPSRRPRHSRL